MKYPVKILIFSVTVVLGVLCGAEGAPLRSIPPPKIAQADALVGAFYYPGWSRVENWYCVAANDKATHPLLGYYREGDPDVADWHIKWALEHGVSFFSFDYYLYDGKQLKEAALDDGFLKAKFMNRFRFCLNWCNHGSPSDWDAADIESFGDEVIGKYLKNPSYLRIENKPVVMILSGYSFIKTLGVEGARQAFQRLDERCKKAGLNGVYLVFGEGEMGNERAIEESTAVGARAFYIYNYPYSGTQLTGPGKHLDVTYQRLTDQGAILWKHWSKTSGGRFWPTVMPGWDRRPWTKYEDVLVTGSTPQLFAGSLRRSRGYLNSNRIVMVEAWNEWGEGSVIEPSVEHRFDYLDQIRNVFCPGARPHTDIDPESLHMRQPVFNPVLPSCDTWRFDATADAWTSESGLTEIKCEPGALVTVSTTDDPQMKSPTTYLQCSDYAAMCIRMRATPSTGSSVSAMGEVFWSTIEHDMGMIPGLKFAVPLDGRWHIYNLSLKNIKSWTGLVDRLRFDPVDVAGVKIEIDEIRVCR